MLDDSQFSRDGGEISPESKKRLTLPSRQHPPAESTARNIRSLYSANLLRPQKNWKNMCAIPSRFRRLITQTFIRAPRNCYKNKPTVVAVSETRYRQDFHHPQPKFQQPIRFESFLVRQWYCQSLYAVGLTQRTKYRRLFPAACTCKSIANSLNQIAAIRRRWYAAIANPIPPSAKSNNVEGSGTGVIVNEKLPSASEGRSEWYESNRVAIQRL